MNINIPSKSSIVAVDNKETTQITSTTTEGTRKRAAPDQVEGQVKKIMVDHSSCEERVSSVVSKSAVQPKFVNAAEVVANARTSIQTMPEISDEELLEMTLKFEMEHPE